jgi:phosphoribosylanthranilate isomerase
VASGADAVGVILHADSPRRVGLEDAAAILRDVPPPVARVGVFVDSSIDFVREAVDALSLSMVQFHGHESPEFCSSSPVPVIKAIQVGKGFATRVVEPFRGRTGAILLDTYSPHMQGGTGTSLRWHILPALPGWAPLFLAGGLNADNVGEAIALTHPFAVDVSSGVEVSPGVKDYAAIQAFCEAVRRADSNTADSGGGAS